MHSTKIVLAAIYAGQAIASDLLTLHKQVIGQDACAITIDNGNGASSHQQENCWSDNRGQQYCVFVDARFNHGSGIAIITTPERAEQISRSKAFASKDLGSSSSKPPFRTTASGSKGRAIYADRHIRAGTLITQESPIVFVDQGWLNKASPTELRVAFEEAAIDMLPGSSRQTVYSLYGRQNGQDAYNIEARLKTNSYAVSGGPTEDWPGSDYDAMFAVHANISKINHSCRPNAAPQWDWDLFAHNLYAVRDVAAGEEITISYLGANYALLPSQERKQYLNSSLGFDCVCDHCKAAQKFIDLSDDRINEILLLEQHLEDTKIAPAEPTAMAELLVSLYKQEGLELFISKAYAIAAREWNGAGYEYQARLWAYQSLKASTISSSSSGAEEYIEDMNDLLNGARHHWSWKYRVR